MCNPESYQTEHDRRGETAERRPLPLSSSTTAATPAAVTGVGSADPVNQDGLNRPARALPAFAGDASMEHLSRSVCRCEVTARRPLGGRASENNRPGWANVSSSRTSYLSDSMQRRREGKACPRAQANAMRNGLQRGHDTAKTPSASRVRQAVSKARYPAVVDARSVPRGACLSPGEQDTRPSSLRTVSRLVACYVRSLMKGKNHAVPLQIS